ncbi:sensor histidine kinase [Terrilactibacillus laevilacticus]|uniref:sensor histidine kinase n=1 Tax=Terrilactibacillus laevilacticus TaxID=1380157 RepID=UPI001146D25D|nr:HAMP domain-containing sensor histidine kinase [Terrilactibacillus laevilacticus]
MFRKTLLKLTLLHAIIFIIIISLFSVSVYIYTKNVVYRAVDHELHDSMIMLKHKAYRRGLKPRDLLPQPGSFSTNVIWESNKTFIETTGDERLFPEEDMKKLKPDTLNTIVEKELNDRYFQTYSIKLSGENQTSFIIEKVVDVTNEQAILKVLLMIMVYGLVTGALISVIAGYFLARRSLRPIQVAWDKQNEFVADASHELRTPLTIIQVKTERLLQKPHNKIYEMSDTIAATLKETRRLSKMVGQLLTLARSDANRLEIKEEQLVLNEVIKQVVEPFQELAEFEDKSLMLSIGQDPIKIKGDREKIHQLLVILLDNAMKFTKENGQINVLCKSEGTSAIIEVKDNGIGISQENVTKIFDRFFQSDASRSDKEGTGLGLSIAKWIVDKHKGKLSVKSKLDEGTTFTIMFPLLKG